MARRARHRWSARLAAVVALFALPAAAGLVVLASPEEAPDPAATLADELASAGHDAEVIECVLRLAARDLRVGPLGAGARDELLATCRTARNGLTLDADWEPPESLAMVDQGPKQFGDDPELDELWLACEQGSGAICDQLFDKAPIGSAYETFGLSCGDRPDILNCTELDGPPEGPSDESPGGSTDEPADESDVGPGPLAGGPSS